MAIKASELKTLLVGTNLVDATKFEAAYKVSEQEKRSLAEVLIEKELIGDKELAQVIANFLGIPFVALSQTEIDHETYRVIPEIVARKWKIFAFGRDKDGLKLAVTNPDNKEIVSFIAKKTGEKINVYITTKRDLEKAMSLYKKNLKKSFDELLSESLDEAKNRQGAEAPIIKIVDLLVLYAYENRASDIHIEPSKDTSLVRFRMDGVLHDVLTFSKTIHEQIISRIKVLAKLKTDEHQMAQDGKMQVTLPEEELDVRVSIVPITKGEKVVMRLLSSKSRQITLSDLGMKESDLTKVRDAFAKPYGMILSTGPTGSGKTTTIYAILKILNTRDVNIASIEDPVEYEIGGINQIQVNAKTELTFANGLRSILRQDPNVIFVGEIRDEETAGIAVNSAMTGHLVLSTLHTNDAATALPRLIDMNIEPYLVSSTVSVIVAQRLIRKSCEKCRTSITTTIEALSKLISPPLIKKYFGDKKEIRTYAGKGCSVCQNTGYSGRLGIFEVLALSPAIKELINAKADASDIAKKAIDEGMTTMLEDGLEKVAAGITTIEEILRTTKE